MSFSSHIHLSCFQEFFHLFCKVGHYAILNTGIISLMEVLSWKNLSLLLRMDSVLFLFAHPGPHASLPVLDRLSTLQFPASGPVVIDEVLRINISTNLFDIIGNLIECGGSEALGASLSLFIVPLFICSLVIIVIIVILLLLVCWKVC